MMKLQNKLKISVLVFVFFSLTLSIVRAQVQSFDFSGNNPESYQCIGDDGNIDPNLTPYRASDGYFRCSVERVIDRDGDGVADQAILKPPALQQLEIWFVRIVYVIWGLVGAYSFIMLVALGYQYMLRGGTVDTELVTLRKRIIYYVIGFAIVFLAVPILSTFFRLLQINTAVDCYNVNMPGFQFFFADLCTAPALTSNPCQFATNPGQVIGQACTPGGSTTTCTFGGNNIIFFCDRTVRTWRYFDATL